MAPPPVSGQCSTCGNSVGWLGRIRGDTICGSCVGTQTANVRAALNVAASDEAVERWGVRVSIPQVSDRDLRRFLQRVAQALPVAAVTEEPEEQRSLISSVWPDLLECAAHMTNSQTPECEAYTRAADGMYAASVVLPALAPDRPGIYAAYWRLWWTAAEFAGSGVSADDIADEGLPLDEARASLASLKELAYADWYSASMLGPSARSGYMAFIDCPACQVWRAEELYGLTFEE